MRFPGFSGEEGESEGELSAIDVFPDSESELSQRSDLDGELSILTHIALAIFHDQYLYCAYICACVCASQAVFILAKKNKKYKEKNGCVSSCFY